MKTALAALAAGLALALPAAAPAAEELRVALPERHDLVELQPGLQVIPEFDLEVFYASGAYWLRSDGAWYTTRRPAATAVFTAAEPRAVPAALSALPDGAYLGYRPKAGQARSTKVLVAMAEPEPDAGPVKAEPPPEPPKPAAKAAPAPQKAPAKAAPAKAAPAKPAPAKQAPPPAKPAAKPAPKG